MPLPEMKNIRFREVPRKLAGRVRKIAQAFFVPGPNAKKYPNGADKFMCPAGSGLGPIPKEGRWYDVTPYLLRCVQSGDAAEGTPPKKPTKKPQTEAPKAEAKAKE